MATSNSYNFVQTRDSIITDAHLYIGAIGEGESASSAQVTEAARMLNMIAKLRAADGMPLWALKRGTMLPTTDVSSISTISHVVTDYVTTTISADEASGQTVLSVTDGSDIADSDQIGIEQDDGTVHWTTVSSGGTTNTLTVASALTAAASSGNIVYAYTASSDRIVQRPLRIIEANILDVVSNTSWEAHIITRQEYFALGNRTSEGVPNQIYYDPSLGSATASPDSASTWFGTIYFYPRFQDGKKVVEFTYHRPFQDFDSAGEHPDFPQEFYLPLTLELAALLAPKFGVEEKERQRLFAEAKMYREEALSTIYPEGSLRLVPDASYHS